MSLFTLPFTCDMISCLDLEPLKSRGYLFFFRTLQICCSCDKHSTNMYWVLAYNEAHRIIGLLGNFKIHLYNNLISWVRKQRLGDVANIAQCCRPNKWQSLAFHPWSGCFLCQCSLNDPMLFFLTWWLQWFGNFRLSSCVSISANESPFNRITV